MTMRKNPNHRKIIKNMVLLKIKHNTTSVLKIPQVTDRQNNSSAHIKVRLNANANVCRSAP